MDFKDFNLGKFLDIAFKEKKVPDHPVSTAEEAKAMIETLPSHDPASALAELTACVRSINEDANFTPGRRARVLMELDVAAHEYWRPIGADYLAPSGKPLDGRDGNPKLLEALQASAVEFSNGFGLCIAKEAWNSDWIKDNRVVVMLRRARWLTRKMILSRMLNMPGADERWTELNDLYLLAAEHDLVRNVAPVFPNNPRTSSVKQEYVRMLLVDITRPDRMLGRDMEFAFRIIGRVAASVQLEDAPMEGAQYFTVPRGAQHPIALFRHSGKVPEGALYMNTANALPRLQAMLERDVGMDAAEPDPQFNMLFTLRERRALINFMLNQWGERPAQRRAPRIAMKGMAMVMQGHANLALVVNKHDQGGFNAETAADAKLRIQFDKTVTIRRKNIREIPSEIKDASASGLGLSIPRAAAGWAKVGALVGVLAPPGKEWVVGVVRRMNANGERLELGIQVLTRKPTLVWCEIDDSGPSTV
ncbi:MAG: hypothetical protein ACKVQK_25080, partial [Burkholderiales bacterium]